MSHSPVGISVRESSPSLTLYGNQAIAGGVSPVPAFSPKQQTRLNKDTALILAEHKYAAVRDPQDSTPFTGPVSFYNAVEWALNGSDENWRRVRLQTCATLDGYTKWLVGFVERHVLTQLGMLQTWLAKIHEDTKPPSTSDKVRETELRTYVQILLQESVALGTTYWEGMLFPSSEGMTLDQVKAVVTGAPLDELMGWMDRLIAGVKSALGVLELDAKRVAELQDMDSELFSVLYPYSLYQWTISISMQVRLVLINPDMFWREGQKRKRPREDVSLREPRKRGAPALVNVTPPKGKVGVGYRKDGEEIEVIEISDDEENEDEPDGDDTAIAEVEFQGEELTDDDITRLELERLIELANIPTTCIRYTSLLYTGDSMKIVTRDAQLDRLEELRRLPDTPHSLYKPRGVPSGPVSPEMAFSNLPPLVVDEKGLVQRGRTIMILVEPHIRSDSSIVLENDNAYLPVFSVHIPEPLYVRLPDDYQSPLVSAIKNRAPHFFISPSDNMGPLERDDQRSDDLSSFFSSHVMYPRYLGTLDQLATIRSKQFVRVSQGVVNADLRRHPLPQGINISFLNQFLLARHGRVAVEEETMSQNIVETILPGASVRVSESRARTNRSDLPFILNFRSAWNRLVQSPDHLHGLNKDAVSEFSEAMLRRPMDDVLYLARGRLDMIETKLRVLASLLSNEREAVIVDLYMVMGVNQRLMRLARGTPTSDFNEKVSRSAFVPTAWTREHLRFVSVLAMPMFYIEKGKRKGGMRNATMVYYVLKTVPEALAKLRFSTYPLTTDEDLVLHCAHARWFAGSLHNDRALYSLQTNRGRVVLARGFHTGGLAAYACTLAGTYAMVASDLRRGDVMVARSYHMENVAKPVERLCSAIQLVAMYLMKRLNDVQQIPLRMYLMINTLTTAFWNSMQEVAKLWPNNPGVDMVRKYTGFDWDIYGLHSVSETNTTGLISRLQTLVRYMQYENPLELIVGPSFFKVVAICVTHNAALEYNSQWLRRPVVWQMVELPMVIGEDTDQIFIQSFDAIEHRDVDPNKYPRHSSITFYRMKDALWVVPQVNDTVLTKMDVSYAELHSCSRASLRGYTLESLSNSADILVENRHIVRHPSPVATVESAAREVSSSPPVPEISEPIKSPEPVPELRAQMTVRADLDDEKVLMVDDHRPLEPSSDDEGGFYVAYRNEDGSPIARDEDSDDDVLHVDVAKLVEQGGPALEETVVQPKRGEEKTPPVIREAPAAIPALVSEVVDEDSGSPIEWEEDDSNDIEEDSFDEVFGIAIDDAPVEEEEGIDEEEEAVDESDVEGFAEEEESDLSLDIVYGANVPVTPLMAAKKFPADVIESIERQISGDFSSAEEALKDITNVVERVKEAARIDMAMVVQFSDTVVNLVGIFLDALVKASGETSAKEAWAKYKAGLEDGKDAGTSSANKKRLEKYIAKNRMLEWNFAEPPLGGAMPMVLVPTTTQLFSDDRRNVATVPLNPTKYAVFVVYDWEALLKGLKTALYLGKRMSETWAEGEAAKGVMLKMQQYGFDVVGPRWVPRKGWSEDAKRLPGWRQPEGLMTYLYSDRSEFLANLRRLTPWNRGGAYGLVDPTTEMSEDALFAVVGQGAAVTRIHTAKLMRSLQERSTTMFQTAFAALPEAMRKTPEGASVIQKTDWEWMETASREGAFVRASINPYVSMERRLKDFDFPMEVVALADSLTWSTPPRGLLQMALGQVNDTIGVPIELRFPPQVMTPIPVSYDPTSGRLLYGTQVVSDQVVLNKYVPALSDLMPENVRQQVKDMVMRLRHNVDTASEEEIRDADREAEIERQLTERMRERYKILKDKNPDDDEVKRLQAKWAKEDRELENKEIQEEVASERQRQRDAILRRTFDPDEVEKLKKKWAKEDAARKKREKRGEVLEEVLKNTSVYDSFTSEDAHQHVVMFGGMVITFRDLMLICNAFLFNVDRKELKNNPRSGREFVRRIHAKDIGVSKAGRLAPRDLVWVGSYADKLKLMRHHMDMHNVDDAVAEQVLHNLTRSYWQFVKVCMLYLYSRFTGSIARDDQVIPENFTAEGWNEAQFEERMTFKIEGEMRQITGYDLFLFNGDEEDMPAVSTTAAMEYRRTNQQPMLFSDMSLNVMAQRYVRNMYSTFFNIAHNSTPRMMPDGSVIPQRLNKGGVAKPRFSNPKYYRPFYDRVYEMIVYMACLPRPIYMQCSNVHEFWTPCYTYLEYTSLRNHMGDHGINSDFQDSRVLSDEVDRLTNLMAALVEKEKDASLSAAARKDLQVEMKQVQRILKMRTEQERDERKFRDQFALLRAHSNSTYAKSTIRQALFPHTSLFVAHTGSMVKGFGLYSSKALPSGTILGMYTGMTRFVRNPDDTAPNDVLEYTGDGARTFSTEFYGTHKLNTFKKSAPVVVRGLAFHDANYIGTELRFANFTTDLYATTALSSDLPLRSLPEELQYCSTNAGSVTLNLTTDVGNGPLIDDAFPGIGPSYDKASAKGKRAWLKKELEATGQSILTMMGLDTGFIPLSLNKEGGQDGSEADDSLQETLSNVLVFMTRREVDAFEEVCIHYGWNYEIQPKYYIPPSHSHTDQKRFLRAYSGALS